MTTTVKILGAGSIGNHLAHAGRRQGWEVTLCDTDPAALHRAKSAIYPQRYGNWDDAIRLAEPATVRGTGFDVVIVGTPPDTHMSLAVAEINDARPRILLIEKPLCTPALERCAELQAAAHASGTRVLVGYNHTLTRNTQLAGQWLAQHDLGPILTLHGAVREHWRGIFQAHPWLEGPHQSYLGFTDRGGGALAEHSHGVNIWQHFALATGQGRVVEVSAVLDMVEAGGARYDRLAQLSLRTESGLTGLVVQDVITDPARKYLLIQGRDGFLEWSINVEPGADAVRLRTDSGVDLAERVAKTRPDDFQPEIAHVDALLAGTVQDSPISLERGLDTMRVIAAAVRSHREQRTIRVDYPPVGGAGD